MASIILSGILTSPPGPSALTLSDLADVSIVSPLGGQYLRYNDVIGEWQNVAITSDMYGFLNTQLTSSPGVVLTKSPGTETVNIGVNIACSGDATGALVAGTIPLTLATVNLSPVVGALRKITVSTKGLVTSTSAVSFSDIVSALGYTPVNLSGDTMTGQLVLSGEPTSPLSAVTKEYADAIASGISIRDSCATASDTSLGACTYNNAASGIGATLTSNSNTGLSPIGGFTPVINTRILIKDQLDSIQNGIYVVTALGAVGAAPWVLTRSSDFDGSPINEIAPGILTYIQSGTNAGSQWVETAVGTGLPGEYIIVGTDLITFSQFGAITVYSPGSGISIAGSVISNIGVLNNIAGSGIGISTVAGNSTVSNTGVVSLAGTTDQISVSSAAGAVTVSLPPAVTISGTMTCGMLYSTGDIVAYSDERLKNDIKIIPDSLNKVLKLRGVTYIRNDNTDIITGQRSTGVIAQDVNRVLPEAVRMDNNIMGVNYGNMVGLLIEAVKELNAKVDALQSELNSTKV